MKVYQFRIIGLSLILATLSFLITFITIIPVVFAVISFVLASIWWCSNYPGMLLKDVSEKVGKDVGIIMIVSSMIGTMVLAIFAAIEATKPLLINDMINNRIWQRYDWYFFFMYIFPATVGIYSLTRLVLFLRK